ncbi:PCRF domain-containing protein, partial [Patescibacteria group bacterium]|nr:PCRF domain-containing protein [Patescibacteria group bacterium]
MEEIRKKLEELEKEMASLNFWQDKEKAQGVIKEISILKDKLAGKGKYDKGGAVITFFAGAGGDDAEDWVRILFEMYQKFAGARGWAVKILHEHKAESGGFKNITFEIEGKGAYGTLKNESGVHRLVRISP